MTGELSNSVCSSSTPAPKYRCHTTSPSRASNAYMRGPAPTTTRRRVTPRTRTSATAALDTMGPNGAPGAGAVSTDHRSTPVSAS